MLSFPNKMCFDCSGWPDVNVNFVGLWVYKDFEGFGKYRGQVIGHDVDMLCNTIYSVGYLDGDEEGLSLVLSLGKSINRSYFNYQYDHYTVNKIDFSYIFWRFSYIFPRSLKYLIYMCISKNWFDFSSYYFLIIISHWENQI